ncbi:DUF6157 family protein [Sphingopyxis sp. R3-92]|uniref:DUF6157 family protein n=1 Tax=Sphingopyxis sp. R3-92 TaxID=3158553 RepID=UPI003EE4E11E
MLHTTNYHSTFISIAPDSIAQAGMVPPKPDSIAGRHYALLYDRPYVLTSDDLLYAVHVAKNGLPDTAETRVEYFSKPKACLRVSPLPKQFGWGIHHDAEGRIAIYAVGTAEYDRLIGDQNVKTRPAVRTKRA